MSITEPATQAEAENGQETRKCTGTGVEHNPEAQVEDSNAGVDSGLGRGFPLLTAVGKKACAKGRGFVKEFVAAIAINAGGRGDKEQPGRMAEAGKSSGERVSRIDAALGDFAFVFGGPAMGGEICAGEMDGATQVFKTLGVRDCGGSIRVPLELVGMGRGETHELQDGGAARCQRLPESCAEHSRGAREKKAGRVGG